MIPARWAAIAIGLAVAGNTALGVIRIQAFRHRFAGERAFARGDLDVAFAHLQAAVRLEPSDSPTYILAGRILQHALANGLRLEAMTGRSDEEIFAAGFAATARGIALNPADAWGWINLAGVYQALRSSRVRLERMRQAGESALDGPEPPEEEPEETGEGGLDPEDPVQIAAALKAQELDPEFFVHYEFLARLYWSRGLREEASGAMRASMARWPRHQSHELLEDREVLVALADAVLQGIEDSRAGRRIDPLTTARGRAEVLDRLGRIPEAISAYEVLRKVGGPFVGPECDFAIALLEQRRRNHEESIRYLERILSTRSAARLAPLAHFHIGVAHAELGRSDPAIEHFEIFLKQNPDSLAGYNRLAQEMEKAGRLQEAEALIIAAVRRFPAEASTYHRAARFLRERGRAREALNYAEALAKRDPEDPSAAKLVQDLRRQAGMNP